MAYVTIKEETESKLHLIREPTMRAWAILVAVISLGFGAAYYSSDYFVWKMAYISGAVFVGLSCMEDWEECTLDKDEGQVLLKKQTLIQKCFQATQGQRTEVGDLSEVISVQVQEENIKYGCKGYTVVLQFSAGYCLGVTDMATTDNREEHELIAQKMRNFLNLEETPATTTPVSEFSSLNGDDNSSTTSDESFEQIDKAELAEEAECDMKTKETGADS